jgi:hypothetical protein
MRTPSDAASHPVSGRQGGSRLLDLLIRRAPGPELPDARDRAGAQGGMAILVVAGAAFWVAAAVAVIHLTH